jgi:CubicO group peptidase (beta-lactamase class C family)
MAESAPHLLTILTEAVQEGTVPGAAIVAGRGGTVTIRHAVGWRQTEPTALPVEPGTIWDLASLSKALCTSLLLMQAVGDGTIDLDEPLDVAPALADPLAVAAVTVRRALAHAGGFIATAPLWRDALASDARTPDQPLIQRVGLASRAAMVAAARSQSLAYFPGTRSLYSDLDFILLGDLLERRLGDRLDRLAAARLGRPFGTPALGFRPLGGLGLADQTATIPATPAQTIAATARSEERGGVQVGEVDDLNAYAMGGVAGHAGLFGSADAVADLALGLIAAYRGERPGVAPALVDRDVLRLFWTPAGVPASTWRLGWDGPAAQGSLAGDRIARTAVGHLGFTGGSLWIDPDREAFVVLLTNRTHPSVRVDPRFPQLRRTVNDAALTALGYGG